MEQHEVKSAYHRSSSTTPSPYLYDVDPSLHASQKPSEVPRVKRNLVQNLVDKFNEEAKRRELYRHHSVDDSLMRDVDHHHHHHRTSTTTTTPGVIEANAENAPNHNHPFSYTTKTSSLSNRKNNNIINNQKNKTSRNGVLAGQRSRSDYNIGPIHHHHHQQQQQQPQQPSELIYAQVKVNGSGPDNKSGSGKRVKTTVHTKVPNRLMTVADYKSKSFAKSTGSLNMSAHEEPEVDDKQHQKNGNYYRYAEVDENIRHGSGSGGRRSVDGLNDRRGRKQLDVIVDNRIANGGVKSVDPKAYETRNVERWSENEVKPNSRKFTEHEYVHEVSVSHDRNNKGQSHLIPKEDHFTQPRNINNGGSRVVVAEDEKKWTQSLRRNKDHQRQQRSAWDEIDSRLTSSESGRHGSDVRRYYFGDPDQLAPEKPPRQKWIKHETIGGHRLRRNSEESAASSGVGLLSSKLVKKANERLGGFNTSIDDTVDHHHHHHHHHVPSYPFRRRRLSEGDSDVFPPPSSRTWLSKRLEVDDVDPDGLLKYGNGQVAHNGYTEESRKVTRREETHTRQRTKKTTRRGGIDDVEVDGVRDRHLESISPGTVAAAAITKNQNGMKSEEVLRSRDDRNHVHREHHHQDGMSTSKTERQVIKERSSSATRRHHTNKNGSFDAEDRMETSESEQPLYGGSQESRMSLGSRLSSADEDQQPSSNVDNVHTPHSVVRQMNKRQINYENSQQHRDTSSTSNGGGGRRFWFERTGTGSGDDVMNDRHIDHRNNNNNINNNQWTSATLSRLETNNKNHRMNGGAVDRRWASNTVDRNDVVRRRNKGDAIRILVNDRDIVDDGVASRNAARQQHRSSSVERNSSFNSRVGSYHSENESLGSGGSSGKSPSGKAKRVNFKSKSASLSPVHREALLRSASPARSPSVAGSLKSNESDVSHVILHATAVADIPPTRQYRLRSANTSPSPPASSIGIGARNKKESRTVNRSFSLLAPWKPRKYKEKYESSSKSKLSATNGSAPNLHHDEEEEEEEVEKKQRTTSSTSGGGGSSPQVRFKKTSDDPASRDSSSEKLDSLSPLPSETAKASGKKKGSGGGGGNKKKSGLLRRHSMPKDSRFANFFRRKKDKESKK